MDDCPESKVNPNVKRVCIIIKRTRPLAHVIGVISSIMSVVVISFLISLLIAPSNAEHPLLLISLDGLGWQFTGGKLANTPNLDSIEKNGVKASYMITVTPTKTWPTHQTYLTGLYPESHGIISNNFWDPVYQEMFILQYDCSNFDPKFYKDAEPIWLTVQKQGYRSAMHFWPGYFSYEEKPSLYEKLTCFVNCTVLNSNSQNLPKHRNKTRIGWPPYIHCFANQSLPYSNRIDKLVGWLKQKNPPRFSSMYINQPDSTGHSYGINTGDFVKVIKQVDKDAVGYLIQSLKKANLFDKINLIVVSDHSFVETSSERVIYLSDYLDTSSFMMAEQGVIGHLWPLKGKGDEIYVNLTKPNVTHMKVYKKENIPDVLHFKHNRRIPPIYIEPDLGWIVRTKRPASVSPWTNAGHGWQPRKELGAIFYAHGPSFKRGYKTKGPVQAVDLYPLMCHLLGIKPLPNNGSLENMKEMLVAADPTSGVGWLLPNLLYITVTSSLILVSLF